MKTQNGCEMNLDDEYHIYSLMAMKVEQWSSLPQQKTSFTLIVLTKNVKNPYFDHWKRGF